MMTAKVFENGRSQAVRLPKEYRFSEEVVFVNKMGDIVVLFPKTAKWEPFMKALDFFSDDFLEDGRRDELPQQREEL